MKKRLLIGIAGIVSATVVAVAYAVPAPKVFVCKFVGQPGVNETLQTGQNPISVSQNAIADFQGVGSYFNDAQGRSLVIAFDTGQDEPECPVPQNPPVDEPPVEPPVVEVPPVTPPTTTPPSNTPQTPPETVTEPPILSGGK